MDKWKPITQSEFADLFHTQYSELDSAQRNRFEEYRVPFWNARIRRPNSSQDETVFVVAQKGNGVLYFDDVECGFNISTVDASGRIPTPGGSQNTLKEAIEDWFPK